MDSSEDEMLSEAALVLEKSLEKNDMDFHFTQSTNFQLTDRPDEQSLKVLFKKFGHKEFRPMQWQIIHSILRDKRDNCAIMTTGYGKSLCYQFPAVFSNGITLVISPLISLMEDQVLSLTIANIPACLLGTAQKNTAETVEGIFQNKFSLVYLTPELCTGEFGKDTLRRMNSKLKITLIAIDEAHCVSSWGHDFRHSYRQLGILKEIFPGVPTLAVTATATERVKHDIIEVLHLRNPQILCSGLDRPNLYFEVRQKSKDIFNDIRQLMVRREGQWMFQGPTIIYCITRKDTEEISVLLRSHSILSLPYHAGLSLNSRQNAHELFMRDKISVVVATIAFGMGIDKPDIRTVIHYGTSSSMEGFYQEVGRAGRDGLPSKCVTFYGPDDFSIHNFLIEQGGTNCSHKNSLLDRMKQFLVTTECRRKYILRYFQGNIPQIKENKNCCDNCFRNSSTNIRDNKYDFSEDVTKYLSAVEALNGKFGHGMYIMFLKGSNSSKMREYHRRSIFFGCGANKSEAWWKAIGHFLEMKGYLNKVKITNSAFPYYIYETGKAGRSFLSQPEGKRNFMEIPSGNIAELLKGQLPPSTSGWTSSGDSIKPVSTVTQNPVSQENPEKEQENPEEEKERVRLFRFLKNARTELARSNDCMPYMISSDYVLMEIAKKKPKSLAELSNLQIEGLTEVKINKFGDKFVEIIRNNCSKDTENVEKPSMQQSKLDNGHENDLLNYGHENNDDEAELDDANDDMLAALCDEMQKRANQNTQELLNELISNDTDFYQPPLAKKYKTNTIEDQSDVMVDSSSTKGSLNKETSVIARNAKKKLPAWLTKKKV